MKQYTAEHVSATPANKLLPPRSCQPFDCCLTHCNFPILQRSNAYAPWLKTYHLLPSF